MFDYQTNKQSHFETACRQFANEHNLVKLGEKAGIAPQMLRNKLNPEQPHKLTVLELDKLTQITGDMRLFDGLLAQHHCLPAMPVTNASPENLPTHILNATVAMGEIAALTVSKERMTQSYKAKATKTVNTLIRTAAMIGLALETRYHASAPTLAAAADVFSTVITSMA